MAGLKEEALEEIVQLKNTLKNKIEEYIRNYAIPLDYHGYSPDSLRGYDIMIPYSNNAIKIVDISYLDDCGTITLVDY